MTIDKPIPSKFRDPLIGQLLAGKYRVIEKIGEGGMGSVYTASQEPFDRIVAVKVLLGKLAEDTIAVKRFEQEARAISKMQHPNTVTIYDYGKTEDGRLYLVMEHLKGRTLSQVLRAEGVIAQDRACRIVRQVCASLADAHAAGIVHRDLKPDNIFLTEVGESRDWVKVLDFGVAKLADSDIAGGTLTQTGMIFGTPKYMSPEQAEGRTIDHRTDIYAIGVVLYELLVGRTPFSAETPVALLLKHISEPPPPLTKVRPDVAIDPWLEAIVMKALEKGPDSRQQKVSVLGQELEDFERAMTTRISLLDGATMPTPPPSWTQNSPPTTRPLLAESEDMATEKVGPERAAAFPLGLTHPMPARGPHGETLGAGLGSSEFSGSLRPPRQTRTLFLVGGIVSLVAAAAILGGVLFMRADQDVPFVEDSPLIGDSSKVLAVPIPNTERDAPSAEPSAGPAGDAKASEEPNEGASGNTNLRPPTSEVSVRFASTPPGAAVEMKGRKLGVTPFTARFPRSSHVVMFVFAKDGFARKSQVTTLITDRSVAADLQKLANAVTPSRDVPDALNERVDDLK